MGLRGPGAARRKDAAGTKTGKKTRKRTLPWKKKGLTRLQRVIAFIEDCPVTKGILEGAKTKLLKNQKEFLAGIYGPASKVRIAIKSEPRGNGKTGLAAPMALCHLLGPEAEKRGEVYSAAIDREQSGKMFNEMEAIILAVPEFSARVNIQRFHKKIEVLEGDGEGSIYEALSSDARRGHGLAPSFWIYDEFAQARDRRLYDNLRTGMGKRKRSLALVISTQAENDDHPLSQLIDDALTGVDETVLVHLLSVPDDEENIFDLKVIRSVNPALGTFLQESDVLAEAALAKRQSSNEPAYRNLRLNQRVDVQVQVRLFTKEIWKLGDKKVDLKRLKGRACYAGLDLSGKVDLTALVLIFPDDKPIPNYDILPFFWTPLGAMAARKQREKELFAQWIKEGHLIGVPGPIIRYNWVAQQLKELSSLYDFQVLGYDRWRMNDMKVELDDIGLVLPLKEFGQGYQSMAPAIDHFSELALDGRLRHGGHPVLTACVANAVVVSDPADNKKFDKSLSQNRATIRTDGAVALAMAIGVAKGEQPEKPVDIAQFIARPMFG